MMDEPRRAKTLKRTISKCGIDAGVAVDGIGLTGAKKLAPLFEQDKFPRLAHHPQHQPQQLPRPASHVYVDEDEPVLLPRLDRLHVEFYGNDCLEDADIVLHDDAALIEEPECSPAFAYRYDDSPHAIKNRYYESIMDSTSSSIVSPSPHHVMYPYTPMGSGSVSTVSVDSMPSPYGMYTAFGSGIAVQGTAVTPAPLGMSPPELQDREYISAANLHAIVIDYLQEVFTYYTRAKTFTFAQLGQMLRTVPLSFRYIQSMVKDRLGIPWHLVGNFVENLVDFICDEDIVDATVYEFATFLRSIQDKLYENMPPGNIFGNLYEFFQNVLDRFKKYLVTSWISAKRIEFPCEFGKKSPTLLLCMECHREHH